MHSIELSLEFAFSLSFSGCFLRSHKQAEARVGNNQVRCSSLSGASQAYSRSISVQQFSRNTQICSLTFQQRAIPIERAPIPCKYRPSASCLPLNTPRFTRPHLGTSCSCGEAITGGATDIEQRAGTAAAYACESAGLEQLSEEQREPQEHTPSSTPSEDVSEGGDSEENAHRQPSHRAQIDPRNAAQTAPLIAADVCLPISTSQVADSEQLEGAMASKSLGAKLGQSFNSAGITLFARLLTGEKHLAIPHVSVPDVRWVDWGALKRAGFKGAVLDKDNTLTVPYAAQIHPALVESLEECQLAFDNNIAILSNSAGLQQFDPDGREAANLEAQLGISVIRHSTKKPAGGPEALEAHFGCKACDLVMVRILEDWLVKVWTAKGVKAPAHLLAPDVLMFIKEPGCW
eukprot:jgi/Mesen1/520/ME000104S10608